MTDQDHAKIVREAGSLEGRIGIDRERISRRFWSKVEINGPGDCWLWTAGTKSYGYGCISIGGKPESAHRVSVVLSGRYLGDRIVRHSCDTPQCVNPQHLVLGSIADNNDDMWSRGRQKGLCAENAIKTHCKRGHPLSGDNLHVSPRGLRICQTCNRNRYWKDPAKWNADVRRYRAIRKLAGEKHD